MCGEQDKARSPPIFPPSDSVHTHGQAKGRMPWLSSLIILGCFSDVPLVLRLLGLLLSFPSLGSKPMTWRTVSGQAN